MVYLVFGKILNLLQSRNMFLAKVAKFRQIWSHWHKSRRPTERRRRNGGFDLI